MNHRLPRPSPDSSHARPSLPFGSIAALAVGAGMATVGLWPQLLPGLGLGSLEALLEGSSVVRSVLFCWGVAVVAVSLWWRRGRRRESARHAWADFATRIGGSFGREVPSRGEAGGEVHCVRGVTRGWPLEVRDVGQGAQPGSILRMRLRLSADLRFYLSHAVPVGSVRADSAMTDGSLDATRPRVMPLPSAGTGDVEFDRHYVLQSSRRDLARALFSDPELRDRLDSALSPHGRWTLTLAGRGPEDATLELRLEETVTDVPSLMDLHDLMGAVVERLEWMGLLAEIGSAAA